MKKIVFALAALVGLAASAFTVVEVSRPESGAGFTAGSGGKLVAVEAFSTNATGTVNLSSVYVAPIYTNAVTVATVTSTNYTVVSSNRLALTSLNKVVVVTNGVNVVTNAVYGTITTNILTSLVTTNMPIAVELSTNTFHAVTPEAFARAYPMHTLLSLSTNVTVSATTNVVPVLQREVAVTNAIISGGTCSGSKYSGAPATNTYIKAHEWLIFTGTATGGFLRLIYE